LSSTLPPLETSLAASMPWRFRRSTTSGVWKIMTEGPLGGSSTAKSGENMSATALRWASV
jgi:hypothetical protein